MKDLDNTVREYLQFCALVKKLSTKTIRAYRCDLAQFSRWLTKQSLCFGKESLRAYIALLNSSFKASSVKRKMASIRAFAGYLQEYRESPSPLYGLRICIKEPKRLPKTIATETLNSLFTRLYAEQSLQGKANGVRLSLARDRVIFELLIATGIRVSELCALDVDSLSLSNKTVLIMGKGAKERVVQIENENTILALTTYLRIRTEYLLGRAQESNPLLLNRFGGRLSDQSVRNLIRQWARLAGITTRITPHMFRHTFATLLLESDVDIRYIQRFLGHSSIKTTEIYTHVTSQKMRHILQTSNPRACLDVAG
ncbi:MAG: tyrosine-type recombinase/integrase [Coriobacteriales bacterium]|nr:tyrosine-type recombinase/integrase [Coriobacteriales bacterium]